MTTQSFADCSQRCWRWSRSTSAHNLADGASEIWSKRYDLIVLDVMLPDGDGRALLHRIRERSEVPIIMLTARGDASDRIAGLEGGADDYVPKPFVPRERKRHRLPGRVIKGRRLSAQRIGLQKAPAAGEGLDLAGGSARRNDAAANRNKRRRRRGHGDAWLKERFLMSINRSMSMEELERQKHGLLSFFRREVSMTAAGDDVLAVGYVRVIERLFQLG